MWTTASRKVFGKNYYNRETFTARVDLPKSNLVLIGKEPLQITEIGNRALLFLLYVSDQQLISKCGQQPPPSLVLSSIIIPLGITPAAQVLLIPFNLPPTPYRCSSLCQPHCPFHLSIMHIRTPLNSFFSPLHHLSISASPSFPLFFLIFQKNHFIHIFKAPSPPPISSCLLIQQTCFLLFLVSSTLQTSWSLFLKYLWHTIKFINLNLKKKHL